MCARFSAVNTWLSDAENGDDNDEDDDDDNDDDDDEDDENSQQNKAIDSQGGVNSSISRHRFILPLYSIISRLVKARQMGAAVQ
ncbi:hypothetical protein E2C01_070202 [Portunus trituberculatus]|uniref:Uncharacterized protein n=1 Tax=Portunus trituberculatus TaxID=210409 RepID=A0A5B7I0Y5_PORTR|nr:hypothetical protein [Portunus trituberculatus]